VSDLKELLEVKQRHFFPGNIGIKPPKHIRPFIARLHKTEDKNLNFHRLRNFSFYIDVVIWREYLISNSR